MSMVANCLIVKTILPLHLQSLAKMKKKPCDIGLNFPLSTEILGKPPREKIVLQVATKSSGANLQERSESIEDIKLSF